MKARILVIEDEMAINDLLCMNLEAAGYETVGYLDGNDASEGVAQDHEFQCALVDIMLPGKDGYTLLPELKKFGIPVIFLTAKADVTSKVKGLKDGAEDYIVKTFEIWDFFGSRKIDSEYDGETYSDTTDWPTWSFLTINAVDGSIIDRSLGY